MRLSILPKADRFFFLLHQSAMNAQKIAHKLEEFMLDLEDIQAKVAEIKSLEEVGDQIIHDIVHSLHRTFVTPIDREDIMALADRLDDVVDAIDEAAAYTLEYKIARSTGYARQLAAIIVQCTDQLESALSILLRFRGSRLKEILPMTVELNRLENEADRVVSRARAELFTNGLDVLEILKWRDIYNDLEGATDRAEDAANVLEAIVLKNA